MRMVFALLLLCLVPRFAVLPLAAQGQKPPQIGAQIWIEPGQTLEQIDDWFARLESSDMPVARLFVMWAYLEPGPVKWDFSLYDAAFRSAEKHHVAIVATVTPNGPPTHRAGDGNQGVGVLATNDAHTAAAEYIARIVARYRSNPALDTWLLVNEPGQAPAANPHAVQGFRV